MCKLIRKVAVLVFMSFFCLICFSACGLYKDKNTVTTNINNQDLKLLVASSSKEREKGLSNRKEIPYDGMIFLFKTHLTAVFWMKDMCFPIDILWIANNKVVGILENVKPEPNVSDYFLKKYSSPKNIDTVIELKAGRAEQLKITSGTAVNIKYNDGAKNGSQ